jgi:transposase
MDRDHFWLNDPQFARLAPHLPTDTRGKPRVDDWQVISGIVHVLKTGLPLGGCAARLRPRKSFTIASYGGPPNEVWLDIFDALAAALDPPAEVLIDSSAVKAHRRPSGGKGGTQSSDRPLTRRADLQ